MSRDTGSTMVSRLCLFSLLLVAAMSVLIELVGRETADRWWAVLLFGTVIVFKLGEMLVDEWLALPKAPDRKDGRS